MAIRSSFTFLLAFSLALLASSSVSSAAIVKHSLYVKNLTINRLCKEHVIVAANGILPGPTISVHEGDTLVVDVLNQSPYNITIHWHGVFQLLSPWADGPEYVTQCPIRPGHSYTYRFNITGQEGTLWWHAHSSWLRATVHGALVIYPRRGRSFYPFPKPEKDIPIVFEEWWNRNVVDVEKEGFAHGGVPNRSDALAINGKLGDLFPCSKNDIYTLEVVHGKTYMLRIINAALNSQLFFKIANHNMTVVAVDAAYTNPYMTNTVVIAPGQTIDVLLTANQPIGSYYMAAHPYFGVVGVPFDNTTTRGIIAYKGSTSASAPLMPVLPAFNDTPTAHKFYSNLTTLIGGPHWVPVPRQVDEHMFITQGLNLDHCGANSTCVGPLGQRFSASMNNQSFVLPNTLSMLQAFYDGTSGIYTTDFPDNPPLAFDYTNTSLSFNPSLLFAPKVTKVKKLKYNAVVEIVLQNTAILGFENHPFHLHGFNFHVLAQGFGNYDNTKDRQKFNLVNPQSRNTIGVPAGGWAVIRFQANNPGIWLMHCHVEIHLSMGLAMAFEVENGPNRSSTLPPPPSDLPKCF
ncbi:hypothetical protein TIFTF001_016985 [Ficus carica]|uniref:Laccase n=1 Tax=Ficus carica TaxID=3494 RepID=A0AA88A8R1_FICCA|nr:hypothetical protein TIFTF001_016985 [Ficus carica]